MNFFLQINSHTPIRADDLIRAYTRVCRHISARVRNAHVGRIVTDNVVGTLEGGGNQALREFPAPCFCACIRLS